MKNNKGFTLVEIIVTVVILSILMAVAVPISLSFMDDVGDTKILNEAQAVYNVAKSSSKSNRLSLEGQYISGSGTYYETNNSIMASYVAKAKGTGTIKDLRYENSDLIYFRYKYSEAKYVLYTKESGEFIIETNPDLKTISEIIMTSKDTSGKIHNYFDGRPVGSTIDSEATSKEDSNGKLNGIGHDVYTWLNENGINSNYFSWKIIFDKKETDNNTCEHNKRYVYAIYISEKKITEAMKDQEVNVSVYKFYADGCIYNLDESFDTMIKARVAIKNVSGYSFPVLVINDIQ